jgi:hypothetical protein
MILSYTAVIALIVGIALLVGVWALLQSRRTALLQGRFGREYTRVFSEHRGNRRRAEAALNARAKRVRSLPIHDLPERDRIVFAERWRSVQALFVDEPKRATAEADRLVTEVMQARGYPMAGFDQRVADLSVDHGRVVDNYRKARAIAVRSGKDEADTEELRRALVCYRGLFEDLLGPFEARAEAPPPPAAS